MRTWQGVNTTMNKTRSGWASLRTAVHSSTQMVNLSVAHITKTLSSHALAVSNATAQLHSAAVNASVLHSEAARNLTSVAFNITQTLSSHALGTAHNLTSSAATRALTASVATAHAALRMSGSAMNATGEAAGWVVAPVLSTRAGMAVVNATLAVRSFFSSVLVVPVARC